MAWPRLSSPQQSIDPSGARAHEWFRPAATSSNDAHPARTVMGPKVPISVGVPASWPVVGSRVRPSGRVPAAIVQVLSGVSAVKVWV